MGAGDGHASLRLARNDPAALAIAIDPSTDRLRDGSHTAQRRKLSNALFVVASIEALPCELHQRAGEVTMNFPWSSLLRGLLDGDPRVLEPLARLAKAGAPIRALLSVEANDRGARVAPLELDSLQSLSPAYTEAGLTLEGCRLATGADIATSGSSWAKRLGEDRRVYALDLRRCAIEPTGSAPGVGRRVAQVDDSRGE